MGKSGTWGWRKVVGSREPFWPGPDPGWLVFSPLCFSFSFKRKKEKKSMALGYMIFKFLFSFANLWFEGGNLQIYLCYLAPQVYIFRKACIKNRIYRTDQCSSDFSCAREFLEALLHLSGLVWGRSRTNRATCKLMTSQKFESRTPLKLEFQSHLVGNFSFYKNLLFTSFLGARLLWKMRQTHISSVKLV